MGAKLLVVEDEDTVALTLEAVLSGEGYDVATAGDTAEAIERLRSQSFDLALLDLRLGNEDGLQVLSRMEELTPGTQAIVLTGYGSLETAIKAMRSGAADYLLKPCDVAELKSAIVRALQRQPFTGIPDAAETPVMVETIVEPDEYLEVVCQEIKTPLTAVIGWTQYAKRRLEAAALGEVRERLDAVLQEAWRIAHLVDAFHGLATLDRRAPALELEPADLRIVLGAAVSTMSAEYGHRSYILSLPDAPVLVAIPPSALATLLTTLLDTASLPSPEREAIQVGLLQMEGEAVVSVRLDPDRVSSAAVAGALGGPAAAPASAQPPQPGGLGVGLHLARRLSEAHGGRLRVERAADGRGIVFLVTLPLVPPEGQDLAAERLGA